MMVLPLSVTSTWTGPYRVSTTLPSTTCWAVVVAFDVGVGSLAWVEDGVRDTPSPEAAWVGVGVDAPNASRGSAAVTVGASGVRKLSRRASPTTVPSAATRAPA